MKKSYSPDSQADDTSLKNRVYRLERKVVEMSKFKIQAAIEKSIEARLKQIELPKGVPNFKKIKLEKAVQNDGGSQGIQWPLKALYDALAVSLSIDEDDMDRIFGKSYQTKRKRDDHDKDPSPNAEKDSKKRQKKPNSYKDDKDKARSSKQGKSSSKPSKSNKPIDADEVIKDVETNTGECVKDSVRDSSLTAHVINKTKWFKKSPRPATPESPDPDWSKDQNADTRPSQNYSHGQQYIPAKFFFNQYLEYLMTGNLEERKYTTSLRKTKVTRYELYKIEEMIQGLCSRYKVAYDKDAAFGISRWGPKRKLFYRARQAKQSDHIVYSRMKILSIIRITVEKHYGYGYLKEIVVKRENQKEYMFKEADFPSLHLNDVEDMFLLYYQNKLHDAVVVGHQQEVL
ncbi:hypothetical protein Tco_0040154 [Tanacetum coccineum]